jgi:[protein-PII] uridylyltransferase
VVLAGGHSMINRAERVRHAQDELRRALPNWSDSELDAYVARHNNAYWLKVELLRRVKHAQFLFAADREMRSLATEVATDKFRGVTELTISAPDHPRLLAIITGACAAAGANIVDAQIFTTTDGMALDTIFVSRAFDEDEDEMRRANRIAHGIERALKGEIKIAEAVAARGPNRAVPQKTFAVVPDVVIDNAVSNRFTVIEVSGLDRPGLLYELTTLLAKLNLNIGSAHIVTFGEKAVDSFYVTDLTGLKVTNASRQSAIRRALTEAFAPKADAARDASGEIQKPAARRKSGESASIAMRFCIGTSQISTDPDHGFNRHWLGQLIILATPSFAPSLLSGFEKVAYYFVVMVTFSIQITHATNTPPIGTHPTM